TIRLLVPPGSALLSKPDTKRWLGELDKRAFTYNWRHPDPRMDELHREVSRLVEQGVVKGDDPAVLFYKIRELATAARGDKRERRDLLISPIRLRPPRMTEAWFC